jgi:hypothetical protein
MTNNEYKVISLWSVLFGTQFEDQDETQDKDEV